MKPLALALILTACSTPTPPPRTPAPAPIAPIPTTRQLAWAELEYTAFIHFNMNTFTDREWGEGTEDPALFTPTALDCRQWARVAKDAGMRGIILTAKHHDGFCLWPSELTNHDVESTRWRDGRGDVLRELSDACREFDLKFGVYLSPWDRNNAAYGDSATYNDYFAAQLDEVLTNYGDIFEVWWDGACGEGPNGKRQIYDWQRFTDLVRLRQPNAVIFSDIGPDVRWVGNEAGIAGETCWSMLSPTGFGRGVEAPAQALLNSGERDGTHWIPAECDVSIRPGWYYHAGEDGRVKSLEQLLEIYYGSIGRNGALLLNLPVDRRGLVHENDAARLRELRAALERLFARDLARGATAQASNVRGRDARFAAENAIDGDPRTYWATDDDVRQATLTLSFAQPVRIDHALLAEDVALGQRIESFALSALVDGTWRSIAEATTVGRKRILRFEPIDARAVRLEIRSARACPTLAAFELYGAP